MEPIIKVSNLQKSFGEVRAVDGLSFEICRNEIFGLLGPNGAGKTTTISMLCGLLKPTGGEIVFPGQSDQRLLIGYCPQENIFYPKLTCLEQLVFMGQMYGLATSETKKRASALLDLMGLSEKKNKKAADLSGGMKRRLNICLALIHDPEILILDEPEAGLDPQSRILVRDFIRNFGRQKTIVLTTHNMDEADRLANRVAIVDRGKLLLLDTPQNLKRTVGEGDVLELLFENPEQENLQQFIGKTRASGFQSKAAQEAVIIKHPNIVGFVPEVKKLAEENGLTIAEIKLRENTLEDVFIHLTGRNLRQ